MSIYENVNRFDGTTLYQLSANPAATLAAGRYFVVGEATLGGRKETGDVVVDIVPPKVTVIARLH